MITVVCYIIYVSLDRPPILTITVCNYTNRRTTVHHHERTTGLSTHIYT